MVKGKRNGLTFTECSVKSAEFCYFHRHIENEATTMQRESLHHGRRVRQEKIKIRVVSGETNSTLHIETYQL